MLLLVMMSSGTLNGSCSSGCSSARSANASRGIGSRANGLCSLRVVVVVVVVTCVDLSRDF